MPVRVLIIDDDVRLHELLASYLDQNGIHVTVAADGLKGLAALDGNVFDAVLLDVMMPGMDGPATAALLRGAPETAAIPVILLTAKVQPADRRRLEALGVAGVLAKPFDPMELANQVSGVLGWPA